MGLHFTRGRFGRIRSKLKKEDTAVMHNQIANMTSDEVRGLIFKGRKETDHVPMPNHIAQAVICQQHFDTQLVDWAWISIDE